MTATTKTIAALTNGDVQSVYSGKPDRCCCGCAGKHSYNPAHRIEASRQRGYEVDDSECNKGMITRVLKALKTSQCKVLGGRIISAIHGDRMYIAYLRGGVLVSDGSEEAKVA